MNVNEKVNENIIRNMNGVRNAEDKEILEYNMARAKGYLSALFDADLIDQEEWEEIESTLMNAYDYAFNEMNSNGG